MDLMGLSNLRSVLTAALKPDSAAWLDCNVTTNSCNVDAHTITDIRSSTLYNQHM